jgi:hypothetical protein
MVNEPDPDSSDEVVDFHLPSLLAQARALAQVDPGMRVVGLVADKGTPEARMLQKKGPNLDTGPDQSVSALISRELAKDIVRSTPSSREWLFEDRSGPHRMLPIIHSASRSMRTMSISYD